MKDLLVENGDLVIAKHDLQYVSGKELTAQKVRLILATNKNEWLFNLDEGINFKAILIKNPNRDEILSTVLDGLRQVDETFVITEYQFKEHGRHLAMTFKAVNNDGEEVSLAVGSATATVNGEYTDVLICALTAEEIFNAGDAVDAVCICETDSTVLCCDV